MENSNMFHFVDRDNKYHLIIDGEEKLSIVLEPEFNSVVVETEEESYAGPIESLGISTIKESKK